MGLSSHEPLSHFLEGCQLPRLRLPEAAQAGQHTDRVLRGVRSEECDGLGGERLVPKQLHHEPELQKYPGASDAAIPMSIGSNEEDYPK